MRKKSAKGPAQLYCRVEKGGEDLHDKKNDQEAVVLQMWGVLVMLEGIKHMHGSPLFDLVCWGLRRHIIRGSEEDIEFAANLKISCCEARQITVTTCFSWSTS